MVNTFPYILTSGVLSRRAAASMGRTALSGQISASAEDNTNLFTMSVTDTDAELAYETLQAVIACYPDVAEVIIGRTNMQLLDETGSRLTRIIRGTAEEIWSRERRQVRFSDLHGSELLC